PEGRGDRHAMRIPQEEWRLEFPHLILPYVTGATRASSTPAANLTSGGPAHRIVDPPMKDFSNRVIIFEPSEPSWALAFLISEKSSSKSMNRGFIE
ncbi:MAG: hypothetical protein WBL99_16140, partial [Candidatus Acidiferrales bacterium]